MVKVSIIVPIYNVEKYLSKCIDSIINQTFKEFELILVDDGSPDLCGEICDKYAKNDSRIVVIHKKNEGVSKARNEGIKVAKGNYIMFVDSDDYLENSMLEVMYSEITNELADIVVCGTNDINLEGKKNNAENIYDKMILNNVDALKYLLYERPYNAVCWGKLYKRNLFNKYKFNEKTKIAEDLELLYKIFFITKKVVYIPNRLYNWLMRSDSATNQKFNEAWNNEITICEKIIKFTEKKCPEVRDFAIKRYVRINLYCINQVIRYSGINEDFLKLKNNLKKYNLKDNSIISNKIKLKVFLLIYFSKVERLLIIVKKKLKSLK
ncbi:MAG: glycosyltransferase [Clostridium sp.]|nr:glycosyltransferase [Clostridium sp.]